jgi:hypothetical protein
VAVTSAGHERDGAVRSSTDTVAVQEADAPWLSVTVKVTALLPSG